MRGNQHLLFLIALLFTGCTHPNSAITSSEHQLAIRQIQTRDYEEVTLHQAMRACIATLQDLDFVLDKVDAQLGTISASKYHGYQGVKLTVTVREKISRIVTIRANATYAERAIEEATCYQDFFAHLDQSLFLVKNKVD